MSLDAVQKVMLNKSVTMATRRVTFNRLCILRPVNIGNFLGGDRNHVTVSGGGGKCVQIADRISANDERLSSNNHVGLSLVNITFQNVDVGEHVWSGLFFHHHYLVTHFIFVGQNH